MSQPSPRPLYLTLRRYAVMLIFSILLPLTAVLVYVLQAEHHQENARAGLAFFHLESESAAKQARGELSRFDREIGKRRGGESERILSGPRDNALYQIRLRMEEIAELQRRFGSERYGAVTEKIQRSWERLEEGHLESPDAPLEKTNVNSLIVALIQLERLHQADTLRAITDIEAGGWFNFPNLTAGGAIVFGVLLVSGLLAWQILRLMERMATRVEESTADLRESERRFLQLADNVDAVFWISEVDTKTAVFVSRGYEQIWGRSRASLEEDPGSWVESILPEHREHFLKNLATVPEGRTSTDEYRIKRPDGSIRWVRDRAFPVRDERGKVVRMAGVAADVTEEKKAQEAVLLSEEHLRSLMESARGFAVFRVVSKSASEHAGEVIFVSPGIRDIMGISDPTDFNSWFDRIHEEDLARCVTANRKSAEDCLPFNEEFRIFHEERGEWRWIRAVCSPIHDPATGQDYFNGIAVDITDEKRAQEKLEKAFGEIEKLKDLVEAENVYLREEMRLSHLYEDIVGESEALKSVLLEAERVSETDSTALLLGETGTGKELVARAIHRMSARSDQPMLAVNCAAIPATLVESELFGREKGAFTGASTSQMGRFEAANGGTIFLDEVGELPEAMQAKLLRVLEEGRFERLGSTKTIRVDVRLIAATNRGLEEQVRAGTFREDLFYRLNVFPITIPPLRERAEDIPVLARHFVKEFAGKMGKDVNAIQKKTREALQKYSWPGNVRQLRNVIERGMIVTRGKTLKVEIPAETVRPGAAKQALAEVEKDHIIAMLREVRWKVRGKGGAAELLGLPASTLESRMKKLGIERPGKANPTDPNLR